MSGVDDHLFLALVFGMVLGACGRVDHGMVYLDESG